MRKLNLQKADSFTRTDNSKHIEAAKSARPKSILESFEYIVELAEGSNLDRDFFDKTATHIKYASRKLHLTPMQTVLLSMFVDRSEDSRIMISEIALMQAAGQPRYYVSPTKSTFSKPNAISAHQGVVNR